MMKWTDTYDIASALAEAYPETDPKIVRYTDLRNWILELPEFNDNPNGCNERILEAIQMQWLAEAEE